MPDTAHRVALVAIALVLPMTAQAAAQATENTVAATPAEAGLSYEQLKLSGGEHMGLLGGSVLFAQNVGGWPSAPASTGRSAVSAAASSPWASPPGPGCR